MKSLKELNLRLRSLVIFRNLLNDRVIGLIPSLLAFEGAKGSAEEKISAYAEFASALFMENENLGGYILDRVLSDENIYVLKRAAGEKPSETLEKCLESELETLEALAALKSEALKTALGLENFLPDWENSEIDFKAAYAARMDNLQRDGLGIFSGHLMFALSGASVTPVMTPDPVRLSDLVGYERERDAVVNNTLALLAGRPAANALLYGDAGTGKSSTVKALVNEYGALGLRLVEVRKNQLLEIPSLVERLGRNPLKFIIFIDDLSFAKENEQIGALKAALEGSVSSKMPNVAIYATSNRRHIVNERFSDRQGDEIHENETIQEQVSLSERFGLQVYFQKPDKEKYLEIVMGLASRYGIEADEEKLRRNAEAYASLRGGRSPRVAKQFAELMRCGGI